MNKIDRPTLNEREIICQRLMQSWTKKELIATAKASRLPVKGRTKLAYAAAIAANATRFAVVYQLKNTNFRLA